MKSSRTRRTPAPLPVDPLESAKVAGLRYVTAGEPGISRRRAGKGWIYVDQNGKPIRDRAELERIKSLVIPPAWTEVWICPDADGHLQALGTDAKGRRQYRYHTQYREIRDATKFGRMAAFGASLPGLRARIEEDLRRSGLPKEKVLAAIVRLMERISVRVGNEKYARSNESFGLTTLRDEHVEITGPKLRFQFRGKSGKEHDIELTDRRLAKIVANCQDLPGQELFYYLDDHGEPARVCSHDVNAYLREISGEDFTAKDFRTWNGTRATVIALLEAGCATSQTECKRLVATAVKTVASILRNRPATCRKYYIHPAVIVAYEESVLAERVGRVRAQRIPFGLCREEVAILALIAGYSPPQALRTRRRLQPAA